MIFSLSHNLYFIWIQELCVIGSQTLQSKSKLVEEAVNELIDLLLDFKPRKSAVQVSVGCKQL